MLENGVLRWRQSILHSFFCVFERQYLENEATTVWISFHFHVYRFKKHLYEKKKKNHKKGQLGTSGFKQMFLFSTDSPC